MKKNLIQFILTLSLFGMLSALTPVSATHIMGGEILYRCTGNSQYEITVKIYRDCNGLQMSQSPVSAQSLTSSAVVVISNQTHVSSTDVTGFCTSSRCAGGNSPYGIEENIYTMTLDLSGQPDCRWRLSWEQQARSSYITTGMADQNFFITATLDKCVAPCNSSPVFNNTVSGAKVLLCHNKDQILDFSAIDSVDGDSLSYELVDPLQAANTSVSYNGQYSRTRPLRFLGYPNENISFPGGFRLDDNGQMKFRPTLANEIAVVAVQVSEWRNVNGSMVIIGTIRRDVELIIRGNCPVNNQPEIVSTNVQTVCANKPFCINITTSDKDTGDTVKLSWNKGIPDAVFTNNNAIAKRPSAQVCWTPGNGDIGKVATFSITATDNSCEVPGKTTKVYNIYVQANSSATPARKFLGCGYVALTHTIDSPQVGTAQWDIYDSLGNFSRSLFKPGGDTVQLKPGKHVAVFLLGSQACQFAYYDTFVVPPYLSVDVPNTVKYCKRGSVIITSQVSRANGPVKYDWYKWDDRNEVNSLSQDSVLTIFPGNAYGYFLRIVDSLGCRAVDSVAVVLNPSADPEVKAYDTTICPGKEANLESIATLDTIQWFNFSGFTLNPLPVPLSQSNGFHPVINQDTQYIVRGVKKEGNLTCVGFDTVVVKLAAIPAKPQLSQNGNRLISSVSGTEYRWLSDKGDTIFGTALWITIPQNATYRVTVFNSEGCENTSDPFVATLPNSVAALSGVDAIRIFPNPSSGNFNISMDLGIETALSFRVYDALGRLVYSDEEVFSSGTQHYPLSLKNISQGAYHLVITDGQGSTHRVLIVN